MPGFALHHGAAASGLKLNEQLTVGLKLSVKILRASDERKALAANLLVRSRTCRRHHVVESAVGRIVVTLAAALVLW